MQSPKPRRILQTIYISAETTWEISKKISEVNPEITLHSALIPFALQGPKYWPSKETNNGLTIVTVGGGLDLIGCDLGTLVRSEVKDGLECSFDVVMVLVRIGEVKARVEC